MHGFSSPLRTPSRRFTLGALNASVNRTTSNEHSTKFQRLSMLERTNSQLSEEELIGPQTINSNEPDSQITSPFHHSPRTSTDKPSTHPMLASLLVPVDSPNRQHFNEGPQDVPRKIVVDPRSSKVSDAHRFYSYRAVKDYLSRSGLNTTNLHKNQISRDQFYEAFEFLLPRVIPDFTYGTREENLKNALYLLNYPLSDAVSKSLSSLGTIHTTPVFYGFLHFMTQLCMSEDIDMEEDDDSNSFQIDRTGLSQLHFEYTLSCKEKSKPDIELGEVFHNANITNKRRMAQTKSNIHLLKEKIRKYRAATKRLDAAITRKRMLQSDKVKFDEYLSSKMERKEKYENLNLRVREELEVLDRELIRIAKSKERLREKIAEKDVTEEELEDIHNLHTLREQEYNQSYSSLEEVRQKYQENKAKIAKLKEQTRRKLEEYHVKIRGIHHLSHLKVKYDTTLDVIPWDSVNDIKIQLEKLDEEYRTEFIAISNDTMNLRNEFVQLRSLIEETKVESEVKEKAAEALRKEYEEKHQQFLNETEKYNSLISAHQKEFEKKINISRERLFDVNRQLDQKTEEYKSIQHKTQRKSQDLINKANRMILAHKKLTDTITKEHAKTLAYTESMSNDILKLLE